MKSDSQLIKKHSNPDSSDCLFYANNMAFVSPLLGSQSPLNTIYSRLEWTQKDIIKLHVN